MAQRLEEYYKNIINPQLSKKNNCKNKNQVPRLQKIIINRGLGNISQNAKLLESCHKEICSISGEKGVITRAKKPIAGFKIRKNMPVGLVVTLRGKLMYSFLDRLINIILPRIRDFQGIDPKSFDGHGNITIGLKDQLMFPEILYNDIQQLRGMDISIITTAKKDIRALELLQAFGMPFKKQVQ